MIDIICNIFVIIGGVALFFILVTWIAVIVISIRAYWEDIINYFRK